MPMEHPYNDIWKAKETAIVAGARTQLEPQTDMKLSDRLQEMSYYLTERQQCGADVMFLMDLREVIKLLKRSDL